MHIKKFLFIGAAAGLAAVTLFPVASAEQLSSGQNSLSTQCPSSLTDAARMQCLENLDTVLEEEIKVSNAQKTLDQDTGQDDLSDKARDITVPNVLSIYGFGSQPLSAVLAYSDDRSLTVHVGESVPGGFHVDHIYSSPPKVVLSKDQTEYVLLMGNGGPSINANGEQSEHTPLQLLPGQLPPSQPVPVYPPASPARGE